MRTIDVDELQANFDHHLDEVSQGNKLKVINKGNGFVMMSAKEFERLKSSEQSLLNDLARKE